MNFKSDIAFKKVFLLLKIFVFSLDLYWIGEFIYRILNKLPLYLDTLNAFLTCNIFLVFIFLLNKMIEVYQMLVIIKKRR
jgi:hypothetical protein